MLPIAFIEQNLNEKYLVKPTSEINAKLNKLGNIFDNRPD